jgi:hypothetical protein
LEFPLYRWIAKTVELLVIGYGLWRGGRAERIAVIAFLVAIIASPLSEDHRFLPGPQYGLAVIDSAYLAALGWVAVRYGRPWIIAAAAFQLVVTAAHFAMAFRPHIQVLIYIVMLNLLGYASMLSLAVSTWYADRQKSAVRPPSAA